MISIFVLSGISSLRELNDQRSELIIFLFTVKFKSLELAVCFTFTGSLKETFLFIMISISIVSRVSANAAQDATFF